MTTAPMVHKHILCVGLVCIDTIWVCTDYPVEDSDKRCLDKRTERGGNASNSSTVLAVLGFPCEFFGTIGNLNGPARFLADDFASYGVKTDHCIMHQDAESPESAVIVNSKNGSRTIIHSNKNFPEVTFEDFKKNIDLSSSKYNWIHFEGRPSVKEITEMLGEIDKHNATVEVTDKIITSVELEKGKSELGVLLDKSDYVFIGKEYAEFCGFSSKEETITELWKKCRNGASVICAWGEDGAAASSPNGTVSCPIFKQDNVVDTRGAGDTFIASTIAALSRDKTLERAITFGCQVAGAKVGIQGFKGLHRFADSL